MVSARYATTSSKRWAGDTMKTVFVVQYFDASGTLVTSSEEFDTYPEAETHQLKGRPDHPLSIAYSKIDKRVKY